MTKLILGAINRRSQELAAIIERSLTQEVRAVGLPAPSQGHEAHAFFGVTDAGKKRESFLDEGLQSEWDQAGLIAVDALVLSGIDGSSFLWI